MNCPGSLHPWLRRWIVAGVALLVFTAFGWQARAQAFLVSSQPPNGTTDVPVTATIVFTFNTPMFTESLILINGVPGFTGSIVFSANLTGSFSPTWDESQTVLTLDYVGNLPAGALITWTINPDGTSFPLYSEEIDFVPTTSGSFTTGGESCDPDGIPDEYGTISLVKAITYLQTSDAAPALKTDEPPYFGAFIDSPQFNAVTAATLTGPGSVDIPLEGDLGTFYVFDDAGSELTLEAEHPSGTYAFSITREVVGPVQFQMQMPAPAAYPPVPRVANFAAAQSIDPAQDFALNFNALTGASGSDFIGLEIIDGNTTILSAPDLCIPLPLANTATSFTIPADTLVAGKTYEVRLTFARTFYDSTTAPPDFASFGGLQRHTVLTIATTGGGGVPQPQLANAGFQGGFFAFTVGQLQPATTYQIQYSSTLQPNSWDLLQPVNTTTPQPIFDLTSTPTSGRRYYRVVTP